MDTDRGASMAMFVILVIVVVLKIFGVDLVPKAHGSVGGSGGAVAPALGSWNTQMNYTIYTSTVTVGSAWSFDGTVFDGTCDIVCKDPLVFNGSPEERYYTIEQAPNRQLAGVVAVFQGAKPEYWSRFKKLQWNGSGKLYRVVSDHKIRMRLVRLRIRYNDITHTQVPDGADCAVIHCPRW